MSKHERILKRVRECIFSHTDNFKQLQFSDHVLLNQLANDEQAREVLGVNIEQKQLMEQMATRHDQLELKHNCFDYKKFNGADTVHEFVQALKHMTYDQSQTVDIERYNPVRGGYLQLVDLTLKEKGPTTLVVQNRFDYHGDGTTLNGYEKIRRDQVARMLASQSRQVRTLNYKRLAALYKVSESQEDYRELVKIELN